MFLVVVQSCNIDYTYFIHLTFKYFAAHFVFDYLLLVASSERTSFRNATVTVRLTLEDTKHFVSTRSYLDTATEDTTYVSKINKYRVTLLVLPCTNPFYRCLLPLQLAPRHGGWPSRSHSHPYTPSFANRCTILLKCEVILKPFQNSTAQFSFGKTFLSLQREIQAKCHHAVSYRHLSENDATNLSSDPCSFQRYNSSVRLTYTAVCWRPR
jgi:hypothetical protein